MYVSAAYCVSTSGVCLLEFFRDGKTWYEDACFPNEDFKISATVAYLLCVNMERVREFAESEGLRPSRGFTDKINVGKGLFRDVVWSRYEFFGIGDKTVRRPCLSLDWVDDKGRDGTDAFDVEKAKAIIALNCKVAEFAATYG